MAPSLSLSKGRFALGGNFISAWPIPILIANGWSKKTTWMEILKIFEVVYRSGWCKRKKLEVLKGISAVGLTIEDH